MLKIPCGTECYVCSMLEISVIALYCTCLDFENILVSERENIVGVSLAIPMNLRDCIISAVLLRCMKVKQYKYFLLPHPFPLLCGVDVSYETPPFSPVLRFLP